MEWIRIFRFIIFYTTNVNGMMVVNECNKLKEIKGINSLNTNQVTNMNSMFQDCHEIEYLDLSNFNISKVNDMGWMFNGCHKLKEIKGVDIFNTNKVRNMEAMFQDSHYLEYLYLSNFNISKINDKRAMFNECLIKRNKRNK